MRDAKNNMSTNIQQSYSQMHNNAFALLTPHHSTGRILLVDNQAHVLRVMKLTLDRNGYDVDTAKSADVALGKLRDAKYDVLITDNGLEKLDGQQLIDTVLEQCCDHVPAMFLVTDHNEDNLVEWCSHLDRTECLEKPISMRYLVGRLDELCVS